MMRCGWCLTGDHDNHRKGGDGWVCLCFKCTDLDSDATRDDINHARARRALIRKPTARAAFKHAQDMADDPDTPDQHRKQWQQQAKAFRDAKAPKPDETPALFDLGEDETR